MLEVKITQKMRNAAKKAAKAMPKLWNSIRDGDGKSDGMIGEEMFHKHFPKAKRVSANCKTHDFEYQGLRIDVKTKVTTVVPELTYEASVTALKVPQDCDIYFFCRINKERKIGWICGWMFKSKYHRDSKFWERGQRDPSNNWLVRHDCYNIEYGSLYNLKSLEKLFKLLEETNVKPTKIS